MNLFLVVEEVVDDLVGRVVHFDVFVLLKSFHEVESFRLLDRHSDIIQLARINGLGRLRWM